MSYDTELLLRLYRQMVKIRIFEEKAQELFLASELPGFVHLYVGEEAIAVGVCENLRKTDFITSTHRGHGHCIAKGADIYRMMAELFGKKDGYCKGKGGSMHIADFSIGMLGANGVVGGGYNLAVGAALAGKIMKRDDVAVCFFGDGASNRGTFHEALNMAAAWKLPVLFVCENNQYASTTPYRSTTAVEDIAVRAIGYGMPSRIVDGNSVLEVYKAAKELITWIRSGNGPVLLECKTYRIKGHYVGDPELYRAKAEVEVQFANNDPIKRLAELSIKEKLVKQSQLDEVMTETISLVEQSVEKARAAQYPDVSELFDDLYAEEGVKLNA
ncbi:thiamine pyrophosphate-dependent dehydrogenase E1 component subunit alpha [Dendrosporobacter sp. 1207_IL3150]|uniref:thiamine pyrophosphate-dependent dehydrogenase E1 component subunit alpha n=1 Tax=Dendrosporobacter sp. 1207_IL3150 TaxID=3084054 RepID=UPI002FD8BEA8